MDLFRLENLSFAYPKAEKKALDGISLSIKIGEFIAVAGQSGCGKTTLLRMLKRELTPHGEKSGEIFYCGTELADLDARAAAGEIGFVMQNPESQTVTDKVWQELSFGLENLGLETASIRLRVGEMAAFFGISSWFRKNTAELSGGQKQLLNLASVLAMRPKVLILDEATAQLDPVAASDFITTLQKLNRDLGLTVILAEHRLEEIFPIADKVLILEQGRKAVFAAPREAAPQLTAQNPKHPMRAALPCAVRIFSGLSVQDICPLTVKEGRDFLSRHFRAQTPPPAPPYTHNEEVVLELKEAWFRYARELPDVMRGMNLRVYEGELFCVLGENGSGKTTMLNVLAGLDKAYRGTVKIRGKKLREYKGNELYRRNLALLPQNPQTVFLKTRVRDDLQEICKTMGDDSEKTVQSIEEITAQLGIAHLLEQHPYDLSGGEQQKCALAKILLLRPKILLLDEPTKGLDAFAKQSLAAILKTLNAQGITVLMVTHDVEFAAENADRCALFFDGEILAQATPRRFFAENNFYTTAANRIARHLFENAVTCEEVIELCKQNKREKA